MHCSLYWDSPKKPHAAPPAGILSVWQIKGNRTGNDLLIIVNGLMALAHLAHPDRNRHCADNNAAALGPTLGIAAVLLRKAAGVAQREPIEPSARNGMAPPAPHPAEIVDRSFRHGENYLYRFRRHYADRRR
jgi:hypothetical protein